MTAGTFSHCATRVENRTQFINFLPIFYFFKQYVHFLGRCIENLKKIILERIDFSNRVRSLIWSTIVWISKMFSSISKAFSLFRRVSNWIWSVQFGLRNAPFDLKCPIWPLGPFILQPRETMPLIVFKLVEWRDSSTLPFYKSEKHTMSEYKRGQHCEARRRKYKSSLRIVITHLPSRCR